ncbi:MAG: hypothetical protein V1915_04465 [Candidatus Bathyarchaeota archaeon]
MSMIETLANNWQWILGGMGVVIVVVFIILVSRNKKLFEDIFKTESKEDEKKALVIKEIVSLTRSGSSLSLEDIEKIKSELRVMDVEKEIVGYALTRLYEAEAEGKLEEKDRELLLEKYKDSMQRLDKDIEKKQMSVKLNDLEKTKTDLIELFNTKLDEISRNIENLKTSLGIQPIERLPTKTPISQTAEVALTKEKKEEPKVVQKIRSKSKADEKIEAIQEEVLKVLERLDQIETEK